jgi:L-serine dehydratase
MISTFDIFKIGIGPSSSHTVGPMKAGLFFAKKIGEKINLVERIKIDLYGSLALTKSGHGTDIALMLGLCGYDSKLIKSNQISKIIDKIRKNKKIKINFKKDVKFDEDIDIVTHKTEELSYHPNGMIITVYDKNKNILFSEEYYSVGGGFIEIKSELKDSAGKIENIISKKVPNDFDSWEKLYEICKNKNKEVWEIVLENEKVFRNEKEIDDKIIMIYKIMKNSIRNSFKRKDNISGGLDLQRRSSLLSENIKKSKDRNFKLIDNLLLWGMAIGEENASYGQVITAPTNGASGVIPATINFFINFIKKKVDILDLKKFILTAGAIGILCKINATISGAEGGCQAEIGTATAMAAAGLCATMNGTTEQCENAAIIGLSHNLGLVCDPVGGLVQVPCIERNAINAVKAVASCRLALLEEGSIYLKFDQVVKTMKEIGNDMPYQYRETALGGLAKNAKFGRVCGNCNRCK